jgi:hypothetical protein
LRNLLTLTASVLLTLLACLGAWTAARALADLGFDRAGSEALRTRREAVDTLTRAAQAPLGVTLQAMARDPALLAAVSATSAAQVTVAALQLASSMGVSRLQVADAGGRIMADIAGGKIDVSEEARPFEPAFSGQTEEIGRKTYRSLSMNLGPSASPVGSIKAGLEVTGALATAMEAMAAEESRLGAERSRWKEWMNRIFLWLAAEESRLGAERSRWKEWMNRIFLWLAAAGAALALPFSLKH